MTGEFGAGGPVLPNDDVYEGQATNEKGITIMKLTTTTQLSVDGVMQGNGPSEEDRRTGFERDGWALRHFDDEAMTFVNLQHLRPLLGRDGSRQRSDRRRLEHEAQIRGVDHHH
jgi:hypothetical protein